MKTQSIKMAIAGVGVALSLLAGAEECSHSSLSNIRLDVRQKTVRTPEQVSQIQPIACNSEVGLWRAGGAEGVSSTVRIWTMSADDPKDLSTWIKGKSTDIGSVEGEGFVIWTPTRQGYYSAELLVGDVVTEVAYFDLTETGGLDSRTPIDDAEATYTSSLPYCHAGARPTDVVVRLAGKVLAEGADYTLAAVGNMQPGLATLLVTGIGQYKNVLELPYEVVPALPTLQDEDEKGAPLDARTNEVLVVRGPQAFVWNSSETFAAEPLVWTPGGLDDAEATVSVAPMAGPHAAPDESRRWTLKVAPGEGVVRFRCGTSGWYHVKMTVRKDDVEVEGSLERVLLLTCDGLIIMLR